ncbi:MAG: hypothetical protein ACRENB_03265 [Gemmatimonadales bacterium]
MTPERGKPDDSFRRALSEAGVPTQPTAECLDDETLGALAEGTLDPAVRSGVMLHVAACPRCRTTVASIARLLEDATVAAELRRVGAPGQAWLRRVALPAAAVLLIALVPLAVQRSSQDEAHRSPAIANGSLPTALAPVGDVAAVTELRWASVPGADRYRVTLFDADGGVVYEAGPVDTIVALPDSISLVPGKRYLWKVEARVGVDRWVASELVDFSLLRGPPR